MLMLRLTARLTFLIFTVLHASALNYPSCTNGSAPNTISTGVFADNTQDEAYSPLAVPNSGVWACPASTFVCQFTMYLAYDEVYSVMYTWFCALTITCCDYKNNIITTVGPFNTDPNEMYSCLSNPVATPIFPYPGIFYVAWDANNGLLIGNSSKSVIYSYETLGSSGLPTFSSALVATNCPGPTGGTAKSLTTYFMSGFEAFQTDGWYTIIELYPLCSQMCIPCSSGSSSTNGSACVSCAYGTYASCGGLSTCVKCQAGTFAQTQGSTACTSCPTGTYGLAAGATTSSNCTKCGAGKFGNVTGLSSSSLCMNCSTGAYSTGGVSVCTQCATGTYSMSTGVSSCLPCQSGSYANATTFCTLCQTGTYSTGTGLSNSSVCALCQAGTYSSVSGISNSIACTACQAGTFSTALGGNTSATCALCQAGSFSITSGISASASCTLCQAGSYSSGSGMTVSAACALCPLGASSVAGSSSCSPCQSGTYGSGTGLMACINCAPGSYMTGTGLTSSTTCKMCSAGNYSSFSGSACLNCPNNSWSAANASICYANLGYYNLGASLMAYYSFNPSNFLADVSGVTGALTNIGSIQAALGSMTGWLGGSQNVANLSQPGGVSDGNPLMQYLAMPAITIASSFTICAWYSPVISTTLSRVYDIGNGEDQSNIILYQDENAEQLEMIVYPTRINIEKSAGWIPNVWQHACQVLSAGTNLTGYYNGVTFSTAYGSSVFSGQSYPRGNGWFGRSHWSTNGLFTGYLDELRIFNRSLTAAEVAAVYAFRGDAGSPLLVLSCSPSCSGATPYGHCTPVGAPICCGNGQFFVGGTSTACQNCGPGSYAQGYTTTCFQCQAGAFSSATGTSSCQPCGAGGFNGALGVSSCTSCAAGTYSSGAGVTSAISCSLCPIGTSSLLGSPSCSLCTSGTYSSGSGLMACVTCKPGMYMTGTGLTSSVTCQVCSAGNYSSFSGSACINCPNNSWSAANASICNANAGYYSLATSLQAYYTFNPSNFLADVSGVTGPLTNIGLVQSTAGSQPGWLGGSQNVAYLSQPGGVADGNPLMQYLAIPTITISSSFTICAWYSPTVLTPWARVYDIGNGVNKFNIILDQNAIAEEMEMAVYPTGITITKSSGWIPNVWQHACQVLSTGTNLTGYYNSLAFSTVYDGAAFSGATYINGNGWLGRSHYSDGLFTGYLDELRIFNRALTAIEVAAVYSFRGDAGSPLLLVSCAPSCSGVAPFGHCTPFGTSVCCGNGQYFVEGVSTACQNCTPGYFAYGNTTSCQACPAGTYSSTSSSGSCQSCTIGQYTSSTTPAATACTVCANGFFAPANTTICFSCEPGTYSLAGASSCTDCSIGTYQNNYGSSTCLSCTDCDAGYYNEGCNQTYPGTCAVCTNT